MQLFGDNSHLYTRMIERAKEGDRRAQKAIYDSLADKMYAICLRYMGNREEAYDVFQDGFVSLFAKLDTYTGDGSFEGWARKIFVNTALMSLRKNDVLKESDDVEEARSISSDAPSALQDIGYKELSRMIAELPAGYRTVFNMFVVEGYSHDEIAGALGISVTTSRSQLLRARAILQAKILGNKKKK